MLLRCFAHDLSLGHRTAMRWSLTFLLQFSFATEEISVCWDVKGLNMPNTFASSQEGVDLECRPVLWWTAACIALTNCPCTALNWHLPAKKAGVRPPQSYIFIPPVFKEEIISVWVQIALSNLIFSSGLQHQVQKRGTNRNGLSFTLCRSPSAQRQMELLHALHICADADNVSNCWIH